LGACGAGKGPVESGDDLPRVRAAQIEAVTQRQESRHLVLVEPARRSRIAPRYGGEVVAIEIEEQQRVEEGQLLVRLNDADVRASLKSAQGAVAGAQETLADNRREADRSQGLAAQGVESARALEASESRTVTAAAALQQARGQFLSAKDRKSAARISAPFTGIVTAIDTEVGEFATPGQPILTISELSTLAVEVPLSEKEAVLHDSGGLKFEVRVRGESVDVELEWVAQEAQANTATFPARLRIPNAERRLRAGESAEILVGGPAGESRPTVPATAVRWDGGQAYVLTLTDSVVHRVLVEVGENVGNGVELKSELPVGTRIVSTGPSTLADGDQVVVVDGDSGAMAQR
jgi:RND family efflux transporter MFP subunit